ncbi:hypothetical protein [Lacibacter cauensis]|uniref:hypothetical protein n=1 Tax=Lacibacter cauensis TaxID=510947 RepID=UPI0011A10F40|nr:hypothetical protein [Lacibacter cauensis]
MQTFILLLSIVSVLRKIKLLQLPFAGIAYPKLLITAAILLSTMMISFADIDGLMQSVRVFHNYGDGFYRNLFFKFSQFILLIMLSEFLFALLFFVSIRIIPGFRQSFADQDDLPGAILLSIVMLLLAFLLYCCTTEVMEKLTPKYINFS